jgi:hypothetical protein
MSVITYFKYHRAFFKFLLSSTLVLSFFSCNEEASIQSYSIPSEYDGPIVTWKLPDNWGENPDLSGPMAGSFHIKTQEGPQGRIGVMPFREQVSTVDVANMFGREMGYPTFNESTLAPLVQKKEIGNRIFEWLVLNAKKDQTLSSPRTALLALLRQEGETWLFPFIADQKLVLKESENFIQFLGSCTLRSAKNKPIIARSPSPKNRTTNPTPSTPPRDSPWIWEIPTTWKDGKTSSMRIASLKVDDQNGSELDISVTTFPGDVGGLLANVNRWIGQIDLSPVNQSSLEKYCTPFAIAGNSGHFIEAYGENDAVLAGALFLEKESWFFKLIGNRSLAEKEKDNFIMFLHSISPKSGSEKK